MMNKKFAILCCALSLVAGTSANAKDAPHYNEMKRPPFEQMEEQLAKRLDLTPEQQEKAKQINLSGREQMDELMQQMKVLREKMDEIRGKNMLEFEAILTPAQKIKLEDMKMERRHFKFKKHHMDDHGKRFDKHDRKWDKEKSEKNFHCDPDRCPGMKEPKMMPPMPEANDD